MEKAETLAREIRDMKKKIYQLEESIKKKTHELECVCTHENEREE